MRRARAWLEAWRPAKAVPACAVADGSFGVAARAIRVLNACAMARARGGEGGGEKRCREHALESVIGYYEIGSGVGTRPTLVNDTAERC